LGDKGIPATMVGEIEESRQGMRVFEQGTAHELTHPKVDPFWAAFGKAASQPGVGRDPDAGPANRSTG
jgi:hypothetical protein